MNGRRGHLALLGITLLVIGGCVHGISRENRRSALTDLTPESILQDFQTYKGRLVLMGGEIIETRNLESETLIEVLQRPLSRSTGRPLEGKPEDGRFLAKYKIFKDPYVYAQGKEITVAGVVAEREVSKIGEREYTYVVLQNRETRLWPERTDYYREYPYGHPYHPHWYPYYPWWRSPYYHPYRYY